MQDLSHVCDLRCSSQQRRIFHPLSKTRDQTYIFMDTGQSLNPLSHSRNSTFLSCSADQLAQLLPLILHKTLLRAQLKKKEKKRKKRVRPLWKEAAVSLPSPPPQLCLFRPHPCLIPAPHRLFFIPFTPQHPCPCFPSILDQRLTFKGKNKAFPQIEALCSVLPETSPGPTLPEDTLRAGHLESKLCPTRGSKLQFYG